MTGPPLHYVVDQCKQGSLPLRLARLIATAARRAWLRRVNPESVRASGSGPLQGPSSAASDSSTQSWPRAGERLTRDSELEFVKPATGRGADGGGSQRVRVSQAWLADAVASGCRWAAVSWRTCLKPCRETGCRHCDRPCRGGDRFAGPSGSCPYSLSLDSLATLRSLCDADRLACQ